MIRAIASIALAALVITACAASGNPIKDDNAAVEAVAKATEIYKLTLIPTDCLYFDTQDEGKDYISPRAREA